MIDISTEAKMLLMENQKTLFKADFILDESKNPTISAIGLNLENHTNGYEGTSNLTVNSGQQISFRNYGSDLTQVPFKELKEKYRYMVISQDIRVNSVTIPIEDLQCRLGVVCINITNNKPQSVYAIGSYYTDIQSLGDYYRFTEYYDLTYTFSTAVSLRYLGCDFIGADNFTVDFSYRNAMLEFNNTGVVSPYVDPYINTGGSYDDVSNIKHLAGEDVMANTVSFSDSVSSSGSFDIGSAIINSLSLTLNNYDDRFSLYDFTGAKIRPYIGIPLETTEWITKGYYTVEKPTSQGSTIPLTMLDNMSKFCVPFKDVTLTFPNTISQILQSVCIYCGVVLNGTTFPNSDFTIQTRPEDDNLSCLDIVSSIAQIAGCWAHINNNGYLELSWYDTTSFDDGTQSYDGGTFLTHTTPYSDGDTLDGGDFNYDGTEDVADGGGFTYGNYYSCYAFNSFSVGTDEITITGIKVTVDSDNYYAVGEDGYVLDISDNPLITADNMQSVANYLGNRIIGFKFRPFNVSAISNPAVEAGDAIRLTDRNGNYYDTYITTCSYKYGNYETFACNAETVSERVSTDYSPLTKAVEQARKDTEKTLSAYDEAVKNMTSAAVNALGFYESYETLLDGSRITYMHDKPLLDDSSIIWKKTIDGFFVSTDGGTTWGGMTADLNIIAKTLSVIGLNADWINAGTITGRTINGCVINGSTINSQGSGHSVSISGGNLTVNNDADNFLNVHQQDGTFAIGGKTFATYNGSVYYGDYETIYIGKAAHEAGAGSDKRLKKKIKTLDSELSKNLVLSVRPVQFLYKDSKNEHGLRYGVIAQELRTILDKNNVGEANIEYVRHDGYHTVEYKEFIAHLINVVQSQQSEIDELKQQVKILMEKVGV